MNLCKTKNKKYVIYQDVVYDVEEYMPTHPGGPDLLEDEIGTNIEEKFEEAEHTKSARNIFKNLPVVGKMSGDESTSAGGKSDEKSEEEETQVTTGGATHQDGGKLNSKFDFDYNKGLWWQVMNTEWTYEEYYDYINDPKVLVNPIRNVRLFDSDFVELFTITPWYLIPLVYIPVIYYYYTLVQDVGLSFLAYFALGLAHWTLAEYTIHRFLFHMEDFSYFPRWSKFYGLHFLFHGIHHAFPQDHYRLVFPPILGIPVLYVNLVLPAKYVLGEEHYAACVMGSMTMYIIYDMVHYWVHHANPADGTYLKNIKLYHLQHHYKNGTMGFGVSVKLWDLVFNTAGDA